MIHIFYGTYEIKRGQLSVTKPVGNFEEYGRIVRNRYAIGEKEVYNYPYRQVKGTPFRFIPNNSENKNIIPDKHLILLGGSFAWGQGVSDEFTFSNLVMKDIPQTKVFNISIPGAGPNSILKTLDLIPFDQIGKFKKGKTIFVLIDDHLGRVLGDLYHMIDMFNEPYYVLGPNEEAIYKGTFLEGRPILTSVYNFLSKSKFFRKFGFVSNSATSLRSRKLTCAVLNGIRNRIEKELPESEFSILVYPNSKVVPKLIEECFIPRNIKYFDYSQLVLQEQFSEYFLEDGHPNAKLVKKVFEELKPYLMDIKYD